MAKINPSAEAKAITETANGAASAITSKKTITLSFDDKDAPLFNHITKLAEEDERTAAQYVLRHLRQSFKLS